MSRTTWQQILYKMHKPQKLKAKPLSPWRANYTAAGNFQKAVPGYRDLVPLGSQVNALEKR